MAMDTQREKDIGLGPDWPYGVLNEGECIAASTFGDDYEIKDGDTIYFQINLY